MNPPTRTVRRGSKTRNLVLGGIFVLSLLALACGSSSQASLPSPSATPASQSEWPMYAHDQGHTNTNLDETTLAPSNIGSFTGVFQVPIPYNGLLGSPSTPVIVGGRAYVGSSGDTGANFFAFDADTGAPVWSADLGHTPKKPCGAEVLDVGIPSTAAVSGNVLVVGGGDGAYYGLDATSGSILWRTPLEAGPNGIGWASPVIGGDRVYWGASSLCQIPAVRGSLQAADLASGALVGTQFFAPLHHAGGGLWNSPALTPDGKRLVAVSGDDLQDGYRYEQAFLVLDSGSLDILASDKRGSVGTLSGFGASPVIFHDRTGRLMAGSQLKTGTFYAYYLDSVSSGPVWARNVGSVPGATNAYDPSLGSAGTLFVIGTDSSADFDFTNANLRALDPETGNDVWASPVRLGYVANNIAVANRMIFHNGGPTGFNILDEATGHFLKGMQGIAAFYSLASGIAVARGKVYWVEAGYLNAWGPLATKSLP